jgi:hypothetical protein
LAVAKPRQKVLQKLPINARYAVKKRSVLANPQPVFWA